MGRDYSADARGGLGQRTGAAAPAERTSATAPFPVLALSPSLSLSLFPAHCDVSAAAAHSDRPMQSGRAGHRWHGQPKREPRRSPSRKTKQGGSKRHFPCAFPPRISSAAALLLLLLRLRLCAAAAARASPHTGMRRGCACQGAAAAVLARPPCLACVALSAIPSLRTWSWPKTSPLPTTKSSEYAICPAAPVMVTVMGAFIWSGRRRSGSGGTDGEM